MKVIQSRPDDPVRMTRSRLIGLLRCPLDGGIFSEEPDRLVCIGCGFKAPVEDGIVSLLGPREEEGRREQTIREREYQQTLPPLSARDWMEISPTLVALGLNETEIVLELGAGSGRYTRELARLSAAVVAVDFSRQGLLQIARRRMTNVLPVQCDIASLRVARGSFGRVLSTLTSNLPDRTPLYRLAAEAGGRAVFSAHHYGWNARLRRIPRIGYYDGSKIFRQYLTAAELRGECAAFFERVTTAPVSVTLPGTGRLGLPVERLSGVLEGVPFLRSFGDILLGVAKRPKNAPL
jgi:SAM-dependent methyltransferase